MYRKSTDLKTSVSIASKPAVQVIFSETSALSIYYSNTTKSMHLTTHPIVLKCLFQYIPYIQCKKNINRINSGQALRKTTLGFILKVSTYLFSVSSLLKSKHVTKLFILTVAADTSVKWDSA